MTSKMRLSLTAMVMGIMSAAVLSGCGKASGEGYYELTGITEGNVSVVKDDLADYGLSDSYLVLDGGGGYIKLLDTPEDFIYDEGSKEIETKYGTMAAAVSDKEIQIADGSILMTFTKSDGDAPEKPGYPVIGVSAKKDGGDAGENGTADDMDHETADYVDDDGYGADSGDGSGGREGAGGLASKKRGASGTDDATMDFWNDDWYGWWELTSWDSDYDDLEGYKFSIMGRTSLQDDGSALIYLWDNDGDMASVNCTLEQGKGERGRLVSKDGWFYEGDVGSYDWTVDPEDDPHEGYIRIKGSFIQDGHMLFDYTFHLVKWGLLWEDFDDEDLPNDWDWYMDCVASGGSMPATMPD